MRLLVLPAEYPDDEDKITVTIRGTKTTGRERVLKVLAHLFSTDAEWDHGLPNVELVAERVEEPVS